MSKIMVTRCVLYGGGIAISGLLGLIGLFCVNTSSWGGCCYLLSYYAFSLAIFHASEFTFVAIYHPERLSHTAYLLDNSFYNVALVISILEHIFICSMFPWVKNWMVETGIHNIGVYVAISGQFIRWFAFYTMGRKFTHYIARDRAPGHVLESRGPYSVVRHPSYLGWHLLTLGAQLALGNVISTLTFPIITWVFFSVRIQYEEKMLMKMFPDYATYKKRVPYSGIPFATMFPVQYIPQHLVQEMVK